MKLFRPQQDGGPTAPVGSDLIPIASEFWVLEAVAIDWAAVKDHLESLFSVASGQPFVLLQPWWPGVRLTTESFKAEFPEARDFTGALWATPDTLRDFSSRVFDLRSRTGGHNSGLWLFGTSRSLSDLATTLVAQRAFGPPATLAIAAAPHLETALALDEGGASTLLIRRQSVLIEKLRPLLDCLGMR